MKKYKVQKTAEGFSLWVLKDFGEGHAWVDTGKRIHFEKKKDEKKHEESNSH